MVTHNALVYGFLLLTGLAVFGLTSCQENPKPSPGQHIRIGLGASPETLDPHLAVGGPDEPIILNLFEGLTEYDPQTAMPLPALAERWEVNADATVYTFTLRQDARWSNHDPVTAHDFVYSWRRILDPATASPFAFMLYPLRNAESFNQGKRWLRRKGAGEFLTSENGRRVSFAPAEISSQPIDHQQYEEVPLTAADVGVEAIDDYTLRIHLEQPTAYFLELTPHWTYRPVHRDSVERRGKEWIKPEHIVTNGPFTVSQWLPGDRLILQKNPAYRDAPSVRIDRATYFLAGDSQALLNRYRVGDIDTLATGLLPLEHLRQLRQQPDYQSGPFLAIYYYMLNLRTPPLNKKEVRHALNLSLDRAQLCNTLLAAGQQPARTLTPSVFGGLYPRPEGIPFDPEKARRLMRQAGHPNGRGLRLRLTFNSLELNRQIAEAVQAQWKKAFPELHIELVNLEWQVYLQTMRQKEFDILRRNWVADYTDPFSFLELMLSTSSNNHTGWANADYDRLIDQANATADPNQRMKLLAEAERLLLEDVPFIPIYEGVTFFMTKPYVGGWTHNILDKHPLRFVWIENEGHQSRDRAVPRTVNSDQWTVNSNQLLATGDTGHWPLMPLATGH